VAISLTIKQVHARLQERPRNQLLAMAVNEQMNSMFPFILSNGNEENSRLIEEAFKELGFKMLYQAIELAYNEDFDS
jgi:hypothetical protein